MVAKKKQSKVASFISQVIVILIFTIIFVVVQRSLFGQARHAEEQVERGPHEFYEGDYTQSTIIGNKLPGTWRPFSDDSPWNTPIPADTKTHPDSDKLILTMDKASPHLDMINKFLCPVWVVNSDNMRPIPIRSDRIFDTWDADQDGWTDVGAPVLPSMWGEPTSDGQICIIDPKKMLLWDISTYHWVYEGGTPYPVGTTFDIWDLKGTGVANPAEGTRWVNRGGRGSGFPALAGMIRPEELAAGEIKHALCFTFPDIRKPADGIMFLSPACRSDGRENNDRYPIMGMRLQLDPTLTEEDFDAWGLNREGKIVARALQVYGMYLGLTGGAMKLEAQMLGDSPAKNWAVWGERFPGFYPRVPRVTKSNVAKIPTSAFRVLYTGEPTVRKWDPQR